MRRRWVVGLGAGALAAVLLVALAPTRAPDLRPHPRPAAAYAEAVRGIAAVQAREGPEISAAGRTVLLSHGGRTARAVLCFHGFTNCPQQFRALGERLYAAGDNVYIPRLPHHGLADRMTTDLERLTAEELVRFADRQVDLACGLGDTLVVTGLSLGGLLAVWAAETRPEVARAVAISPLFGLSLVPGPLTALLANLWLRTPGQFPWWDPRYRAAVPGPSYVYPRYSTRALAEALRLAQALTARARRSPPAARSLAVVTLDGDPAVDARAALAVAGAWRERGSGRVATYRFASTLGLGHDLIDPEQPYQKVAIVYPVLERLIAGE
jgi:carboxylesterase